MTRLFSNYECAYFSGRLPKQLKQSEGDSGGPYFDASGKAYGLASSGTTAIGDLSAAIVSSIKYVEGFTLEIGK